MLSVFPDLLDFSIIASTLLRLTVGGFLFVYGLQLILATRRAVDSTKRARIFSVMFGLMQCFAGSLLVVGFLTQPAAIAGATLSLISYETGRLKKINPSKYHVQLLLAIICLSLLFLGPGLFSFDLPL